MKQLDPSFIPHSVEAAVRELFSLLEPTDIANIKRMRPVEVHMGMGMYLRNNWQMWDTETMLNRDFQKRYNLFGHGDDVSGIILHCLWKEARGEPWGDQEVAEKYRKHWKKYGLNPETGEKIPGFRMPSTMPFDADED